MVEKTLTEESNRARRYNSVFSIIIMDIDHFKVVNDTFGHQTGDTVLQGIATILRSNVRNVDIVGRWGGKEFLIICPEVDLIQGCVIAEKLRKKMESCPLNKDIITTGSFGVATFTQNENITELIRNADQHLYQAKANGRNRVEPLQS